MLCYTTLQHYSILRYTVMKSFYMKFNNNNILSFSHCNYQYIFYYFPVGNNNLTFNYLNALTVKKRPSLQ